MIAPPVLCPARCQGAGSCRRPASPSSAVRVAWYSAKSPMLAGAPLDRPWPGRSQAITAKPSPSAQSITWR